MKIVVTFFRLAFFQCVSDATYWVWNKSSDFFRTFFFAKKIHFLDSFALLFEMFWHSFLTTRKEGSFLIFNRSLQWNIAKNVDLIFGF